MYTHSKAPIQLKITGAVLAIAALAIVLLSLAVNARPTQAENSALQPAAAGAVNPQQPKDSPATTPDACNSTISSVVDSGHIAIFDIYYDAANKVLVNNPCPPAVTYETRTETDPGSGGPGGPGGPSGPTPEPKTVTVTVRGPISEANIGQTIFHIRQQAEHTLTADEATNYPFLGSEDDTVWLLPRYNTEYLDIGFSAGLLDSDDWNDLDFEFESIREPGLDADDRGQVYVFGGPSDMSDTTEVVAPVWNSKDPDANEIEVLHDASASDGLDADRFKHHNWAFTKAGTYVLAVHVKGHPNLDDASSQFKGTGFDTLTSEVRHYTFHVGPMADLAVTVEASDAAPEVNTDIELTVTASNAGPDAATNTEVTVSLPADLTYSSHTTATGAYDSATGVWSVGDLATPVSADSPTTATLAVTANVGTNTHGQDLETTATILARETIGSSTVQELDPDENDNTAAATVTPVSEPNQEPMFLVERSVPENAHHDLAVGDPVPVSQGDDDALTYQLTGDGADKFYAESVAGGAQIKVYGQAGLDYETVSAYNLVLGVSDGKDAHGNADSSIDNSVAVKVSLQDIDETVTATLAAARAGNTNTYTYTVTNLPSDATQIFYRFALRNTADPRVIAGSGGDGASPITDSYTYGSGDYVVTGTVQYVSGGATHYISTNSVTLTIP